MTAIDEKIKKIKNGTLREVCFNNDILSPEQVDRLASALKSSSCKLTSLSLIIQAIGDAGAAKIADALKVNKSCRALDLGKNGISATGAEKIADALNVNKSLTELSLSDNDIGSKGAQKVADAIKINKSLTMLDLSFTGFSALGAEHIADALNVKKKSLFILLSPQEEQLVEAALRGNLNRPNNPSQQQPSRRALLIGNNYSGTRSALRTPENEVRVIGEKLQTLGFQTTVHTSLDRAGMNRAWRDFESSWDENCDLLVWFSGHGLEHQNANYLVPEKASGHPDDECVPLKKWLKSMNQRNGRIMRNLVVLDACRHEESNDTFRRTRGSGGISASVESGRGLNPKAGEEIPKGAQFAIFFAADPGEVAYDGNSRSQMSHFSNAFVENLASGVELDSLRKQVTLAVLNNTNNKQRPWLNSCLTDDFFF